MSLRIMITKGEGLETEDFSLKSDELVRISVANIWKNQQIMLGVAPDGKIILKGKRNLQDIAAPIESLFEGTYEEFLARLV